MPISENVLQDLVDREAIRQLALVYSRAVDRKDIALLRTLYTKDGTDDHGAVYDGSASGFIDFLEVALPNVRIGAHYVCNHLIALDGDLAEGEVYAIGYAQMPDGQGGLSQDFVGVRYIDRYRRVSGTWYFASRKVMFDHESSHPLDPVAAPTLAAEQDPSYSILKSRLFARGPRG